MFKWQKGILKISFLFTLETMKKKIIDINMNLVIATKILWEIFKKWIYGSSKFWSGHFWRYIM